MIVGQLGNIERFVYDRIIYREQARRLLARGDPKLPTGPFKALVYGVVRDAETYGNFFGGQVPVNETQAFSLRIRQLCKSGMNIIDLRHNI